MVVNRSRLWGEQECKFNRSWRWFPQVHVIARTPCTPMFQLPTNAAAIAAPADTTNSLPATPRVSSNLVYSFAGHIDRRRGGRFRSQPRLIALANSSAG